MPSSKRSGRKITVGREACYLSWQRCDIWGGRRGNEFQLPATESPYLCLSGSPRLTQREHGHLNSTLADISLSTLVVLQRRN